MKSSFDATHVAIWKSTLSLIILVSIIFSNQCSGQELHSIRVALELPSTDDLTLDSQAIINICSNALLNKNNEDGEMVAKVLLARAKALSRLGKHQEALRDLGDYLLHSKDSELFRHTRAAVLFALNRIDDADADLKEAIRLNPKSASIHAAKGALLLSKKNKEGALGALERAVVLDPTYALAYFYRGLCFDRVDPEKCLANMNKFIELSPYFPGIKPELPYYYRGFSLSLLNRPTEALSSLLLARKLNPSSDIIARDIAIVYGEMGKFHLAAHYAEEFARLCPADVHDPSPDGMRTEYYFRIGRLKDAIRFADKFLMSAKDDRSYFIDIANVHVLLGQYQMALEFYDRALDGGSDRYSALVGKAMLLSSCPDARFRDGNQAVKLAFAAHETVGTRKELRWMSAMALAQAYAEMGNFKEAERFAQESIERAGPSFGRRNELEQRLTLIKRQIPFRYERKQASEAD